MNALAAGQVREDPVTGDAPPTRGVGPEHVPLRPIHRATTNWRKNVR